MDEQTKASALAIARVCAKGIVALAAYGFGVALDADLLACVIGGAVVVATTAYAAWRDHDVTGFAQLVKQLGKAAADELETLGADEDLGEEE